MEDKRKIMCDMLEKVSSGVFLSQELYETDNFPSDMDSIAFIEFIVEVEEYFGFEFDDEMLDSSRLETFTKLVEYVDGKKGGL